MVDTIIRWVVVAVILAIGSAALSLLLYVLTFANLKRLLFIRKLGAHLRDVPDDVPLVCQDNKVYATLRKPGAASEDRLELYSGGITWKGGSKLAGMVKRTIRRQYPLRLGLFLLLFVPLVLGSIYLSFAWDWRALSIVALLILHQFWPFHVFAHPLLVDLFEGVR